uniref:SEFIR domain-containing protein n=1 Tax=Mesocestoides corti TaxID=53468 RepID=A0A5K3FC88_MESCO
MRLPLSRIFLNKRHSMSEHPDVNSDLDYGHPDGIPRLNLTGNSTESISKLGINESTEPSCSGIERNRVILFLKSTTESERKRCLIQFAQHMCVVYEYQIGFLQGLKAVHSAADYVADLLLKSIQIGRITSFSPSELTLQLLHDVRCKPSSQMKCVKTSPMTGTGEQLSWRLGDIWTRPGLRHNEVGGENCHNLNIVTHFLAPCLPDLETKRPDIYGYRNLIVLPTVESNILLSGESIYANASSNTVTVYTNCNSEAKECLSCFDIFPPDEDLITLQHVGSVDSSPIRRTDVIKRHQRQHLHRAYRPVFFVIYERPSVIDHLTECESFAAFCKRQNICPVMFLNQETDLFEGRVCVNLFQHFDIFCLTTNGYVSKTYSERISNHVSDPVMGRETRQHWSADMCLGGIDNPGFIS